MSLNNSEATKDQMTSDLIATLLMLSGHEAKIEDGCFKGLNDSDWQAKEKNKKQQEEFFYYKTTTQMC